MKQPNQVSATESAELRLVIGCCLTEVPKPPEVNPGGFATSAKPLVDYQIILSNFRPLGLEQNIPHIPFAAT
jgi:hypothetical protein